MFEPNIFFQDFSGILTIVPYTLGLALLILFFAILIGGILSLIDQYKVPVLSRVTAVCISFLRGTPLLVQLYLAYYGLPKIFLYFAELLNLRFDPNQFNPVITVIVSYSICFSAFQSEIIRGAFMAVSYGQIEAAQSLGFSSVQTLRRIVVPQAVIEALPNFLNSYLSIIKSLSLAFMVSVVDILAKAKLESALNFRYLESYAAAAAVYWLLCVFLTVVFRKYEKTLRKEA
ncbi:MULTISPECIES: amino acid ABC transporter permease [unclassified Sporolactobacillus]|uniref:amino acid ABC transporter permease n=1 Tax=unclassified Sporolactobacillus TaxID=2628533 RepID=UPI0023681269|nr:amino acid ABC transporter permease [Sporolactobacillus sp. CQH2019]MDD9149892.1 amino acid ABC transporter permease [Sporolactobacillus sp. CQH2019]